MNPDKPFVLRGGDDKQTALHNRIAVIKRVEYLTGVDLDTKSIDYLKALDLEMWKRWLSKEPPDKKIDEEFCQRMAEVVKAMEGKPVELNQSEFDEAVKTHETNLKVSNAKPELEVDTKVSSEAPQQK